LDSSGGEPCPHLVDDAPRRRHQPEDDRRPPIDDGFAIHEDLVLTVIPPDRFHLDPQLTPDARRHTDGMEPRDSVRAITNGYSGHGNPRGGWQTDKFTSDHPDDPVAVYRNRTHTGLATSTFDPVGVRRPVSESTRKLRIESDR
jgi:hypothetical protein